MAMASLPGSGFYEFIPRSSEQCGAATFLKVAESNMVNLRLQT
jgi:hypothetical protein